MIIECKKQGKLPVTSAGGAMVGGAVETTRTTQRVVSSPLVGCLWVVVGRYSEPRDATTARYYAHAQYLSGISSGAAGEVAADA
mmetsp:Transcript_31926/g.61077  ORF Transcript_31926/g.61077 Transcript_31926/m.61077 type:complete len:84 (-) Transcript_31926:206-457(-)